MERIAFSDRAFNFYAGLMTDNSRAYWEANRATYEAAVREPMAALLDRLAPTFGDGVKLFRPHRDVRFSADKSPYKTAHGAAHRLPGVVHYLHLDASGLMVACGNYVMEPDELDRYRQAVAADFSGVELSEILAALGRRRSLRVGPGGAEPLKTAPRGFPRDHPRVDLLRQKGIIATRTRPPSELDNGGRVRRFVVETFEVCADLTDWLRRYVGEWPS